MSDYEKCLTTLRRVPDDIVLAVATREIVPKLGDVCLCGYIVREALARVLNVDAAAVSDDAVDSLEGSAGWGDVAGSSAELAQRMFGGTREEWRDIYYGINQRKPYEDGWNSLATTIADIEEAFAVRVLEAVEATS